jgi:hypothetical protein
MKNLNERRRLWYWTTATENLFDLSKVDLYTFSLLVDEAFKTDRLA